MRDGSGLDRRGYRVAGVGDGVKNFLAQAKISKSGQWKYYSVPFKKNMIRRYAQMGRQQGATYDQNAGKSRKPARVAVVLVNESNRAAIRRVNG